MNVRRWGRTFEHLKDVSKCTFGMCIQTYMYPLIFQHFHWDTLYNSAPMDDITVKPNFVIF